VAIHLSNDIAQQLHEKWSDDIPAMCWKASRSKATGLEFWANPSSGGY